MKYERNFYQIRQNKEILEELRSESDSIGYYSLPFKETSEIKNYAKNVKQKQIYLIGIGGSSLGSRAIYTFLRSSLNFKKNLYFLDTIDPLKINSLIKLNNSIDAHFVVISKSGDTIEPISILKYVDSVVSINHLNCTVISEEDSPLHRFAKVNSLRFFSLEKNVGGRFSVFSVVGLLPLAIIGVDIDKLLLGAKEVHESFFREDYYYDLIINKARFLVENKGRFNNNIIFSYSSVFKDFNKWYVQLWAESLGKINKNGTRQGLTPISLLGPDDQHSFLQLIIDGVRDKTVTIFKIENLRDSSRVPDNSKFDIFDSNFINNRSFNDLINFQADATYKAILEQKDIPCDIITISTIDEKNIGRLIYRFQLLVSAISSFMQINAYDQPGVELGKKILRDLLKDD